MENINNDRKKNLFLKQVETLKTFLKTGAINKAQFNTSYNGLVNKMNINDKKLKSWLIIKK